MKKQTLLILFCITSINLFAQDKSTDGFVKSHYFASASEIIFSWGNVTTAPSDSLSPNAILRFSPVFNIEEQFHYDFSKQVGLYTGLSIRNVGFINDLNDTVKVKQRVYSIGVPLALKIGNMENNFYMTLGGEAEFAFAYKQKVFINGEKHKTVIWFSDRTNTFLPSVFAELRSRSGIYIKFKYYLVDFLTQDKQKLNVDHLSYHPTKSTLMYLSMGWIIPETKVKKDKAQNIY